VIQRENPAVVSRVHRDPRGPVRTCVGCRKRELAVGLLRAVAVSAGNGSYSVTVDTAGNVPGRGAWLHPEPQCASEATRRRAFARALRITGTPDTSAVIEYLELSTSYPGTRAPRQQTGSKKHEHTVKSR